MCIFCQIVAKEIPAKIVYEDEDILAILDISQATRGHTLVMPKEHYENILELPEDLAMRLNQVTVDIAKKLISKLTASGCNILTNINESAGQSVFHCHMHILPRYPDDDLKIRFSPHQEDLDEILTMIND